MMKFKLNLKKFNKVELFKSKALLFGGIGIVITLIIFIIVKALHTPKAENSPEETKEIEEVKEIKIIGTGEVISTDELWRGSMQDLVRKRDAEISSKLNEIEKKQNELNTGDKNKNEIKELHSRIEDLTSDVERMGREKSRIEVMNEAETTSKKSNNIAVQQLSLSPDPNADNYIPAGSIAKAVLLSGVDVSTAMQSSANPDPIVMKIVDYGTLPNSFRSNLLNCHVVGAVHGDLSSERAKIRLEELSCVNPKTKKVIETEIVGFVTGEDGRSGVRGEVVSTEGKLLGNSLLSGVLSGLANNFNPNTSYQPNVILGNNQQQGVSQRFKDSMSSGATSALDRLSKYYIERAENLQPVIQIGAGRKVDILFTKGVFLGSDGIRQKIQEARNKNN